MEANRVWADIDLDALARNLRRIRARAGPVAIMLVLKADAYGHGAVAIAHRALQSGVTAFGVGTSAEALELRQCGIRAPILVLGTILDAEAPACLRHGIHIALHSSDRCQMLQQLARRLGRSAHVHLMIDTGMGSLGVPPGRAMALLDQIRLADHLQLAGVMTHMASPEGALDPGTRMQIRRFQEVIESARERNLLGGRIHAANSACIFTDLRPLYDLVRPGLSAYGALPGALSDPELEGVMSLRSQIVFLKDVPKGSPVGYGSTWKAEQPTRIATVSVGYNDGLPWRLGNRGEVLVHGRRAPIAGSISMDYTCIDVGHLPGVRVGDRVTLFGRDGRHVLALEEVARRAETIPYEITCAVGKRVERVVRGAAPEPEIRELEILPVSRPERRRASLSPAADAEA